MSGNAISRRDLFLMAAAGPLAAAPAPLKPAQAWIIVEQGWEYNDEVSYPEGEYVQPQLFYDQAAAQAHCQHLCEEFFGEQTPLEFEVDFEAYGCDIETATWADLLQAGFPPPYRLQELSHEPSAGPR